MKKIIKLLLILFGIWLCTPFTVLVLGSDAYKGKPLKGSRTDGMILVKVTPLLAKVRMVSIPRDTYAEIPCEIGKNDKITHAHAYGGTTCAKQAVERLLDTKVNYTVLFRFDDVISLTDIIDGVDIVANHSFVQDGQKFVEGESYNIKGERALAYTRHRKTDSAFKRDERQRQVIQGIVKKLLNPLNWKYIPNVASYTLKNMEIKFNPIRVISAAPALLIHGGKFEQMEIKGDGMKKGGVYYFNPSEESMNEAKRKFKVFF